MAPLVKAGGLGDVMGSLPKVLIREGLKVRVVMPYYRNIVPENSITIEKSFPAGHVNFGEIPFEFGIKTGFAGDIPLILIEQGHFFNRSDVYGPHGGACGYKDNLWRYAMLAHGAVYAMKVLGAPLIVHAHDWSGGIVPAAIRQAFGDNKVKNLDAAGFIKDANTCFVDAEGARPAIAFTIHNLRYQGVYGLDDFYDIGLDFRFNSSWAYEHFGTFNSLKGGIKLSDAVTTVSPTYSDEITRHDFGFGLDGELADLKRKGRLSGILNGIDLEYWNPATDRLIGYNMKPGAVSDYREWERFKENNRKHLFSEISLPLKKGRNGKPLPLIGVVSRLTEEKGIDEFLDALFNWNDFPFQVVLLGSGGQETETKARYLSQIQREKVFVMTGSYDESLSHKIYAASDIFAMPSKFEPCGLSQMIAMRYGCAILAGDTGGLHDTVSDINDPAVQNPSGILIRHIDTNAISWGLNELYNIFSGERKVWRNIMVNSANKHFGWDDSAKTYEKLYYEILK